MSQKTRRKPTVAPVANSRTFTITAVSAGAVWTFAAKDDAGNIYNGVTFSAGGSPTTATVAAGLAAAWNASTNPKTQRSTAIADGPAVTITSDTNGIPLPDVSLSDDESGTHGVATTVNVGPLDFNDGSTWVGDSKPVDGDDVSFAADSSGAEYGLDQTGQDYGLLEVLDGFADNIGRIQDGVPYYLRCVPSVLEIGGDSPRVMIDVLGAAVSPNVRSRGSSQSQGSQAVMLKGDNIQTLSLYGGQLGVATQPGDTASVDVMRVTNDQSQFVIGDGVTLGTLDHRAGEGELGCAATLVTVGEGAKLSTIGTGVVAALKVYGTVYSNSHGNVTLLKLEEETAVVDFSQDRTPRTVVEVQAPNGGTIIAHENITFSGGIPSPPSNAGKELRIISA